MAEVRSLGLHTPVALSYLISEGILPDNPQKDLYQWETYVCRDEHGDVEEEVLATKHCVVWSRGEFIQKVYRFEVEGEGVRHAVLTRFPPVSTKHGRTSRRNQRASNGPQAGVNEAHTTHPEVEASTTQHTQDSTSQLQPSARALVVFLKSKAHVYFLQGSSYIVDLPVEVERAFPAPRGILIQRKSAQAQSVPPTPQLPRAPANSFLSAQFQQSQTLLQSPSFAKSFASSQPLRPSPLSGSKRLDSILQDLSGNLDLNDEDVGPLYTLTSPLLEFGAVAYSLQHQKPRISAKSQPGISVTFEPLDPAESVVYMSPHDELAMHERHRRGPFMLLVTANSELQMLTVWHAWYLEEKSLSSLMKQRAAQKAAKARRRSSFLSAGTGTGTATPAVRQREGTRESFAAGGSIRITGDQTTSNTATASSRKPTQQEEADVMASQMDPDYQPAASQTNARESRRISSLNADVRASQSAVNASFGGAGGRRNVSFGGANERRSFGHRKSRGSTPGSTFNRSLGPDDLMDIDGSLDVDGEESIESIVRHVRATYEAAGVDSIYGDVEGDFRRDLLVRKIYSLPITNSIASSGGTQDACRVVILSDDLPLRDSDHHRLNVYIHNTATRDITCLQLLVVHRAIWPELEHSTYVAVPAVLRDAKMGKYSDVIKLGEEQTQAILLANRGLVFSVHDDAIYPLTSAMEPGANQPTTTDSYSLAHSGARGRLDEYTDTAIYYRRKLQLTPQDRLVRRLLEVCRLALPMQQAQRITGLWCAAHALLVGLSQVSGCTANEIEWIALATTIFAFGINLLDEKVRDALSTSQVAVQQLSSANPAAPERNEEEPVLNRSHWRWATADSTYPTAEQDPSLAIGTALANQLVHSSQIFPIGALALAVNDLVKLMLALHIFSEEQKLCTFITSYARKSTLVGIVAQLGEWLGLPAWGFSRSQYYELEGANETRWLFVRNAGQRVRDSASVPMMPVPVGVFQWFDHALKTHSTERYPTIDTIAASDQISSFTETFKSAARELTPRIAVLSDIIESTSGLTSDAVTTVRIMARYGITPDFLEALPIAIAAPLQEAVARCEKEPPTTWPPELLSLVRRDDLDLESIERGYSPPRLASTALSAPKDVQSVCNALEHHSHNTKTKEADRHAVSQLIFNEDRRLLEATSLMHFNSPQVAECPKQPDWSDADHLERQRRMMLWVTVRMTALPAGDAMIHFDSQTPLLTDRYHLSGFSNSCLMLPMGHTLTTDRSGLTEEKVAWAYFHAGVSVGLRISRSITGIDTSWIAFNKPNELTNRHAGLLLALGLGGHLRHMAKWLSFKYLTPKHTMTSVGLLLGLSASYMGSMDGLITRMLSVHITRMLPPGAAELNISPVTQTAGLMGIGLLYYNTQHRRMSEIMLSEIEYLELEDPDSGPDLLRDESYRLSAGFALGYINLGKGKDLRGLHGMHLPERLLAFAVGSRPVNAVHVFDRATAGAVIAIALVFMKSGDQSIASKIDIPDTEPQFDHVRPDVLMLRVMAKHVILWDEIGAVEGAHGVAGWIHANLPKCYSSRFPNMKTDIGAHPLKTSDIPFYNIVTGLGWALSLKFAGSGNEEARDEILNVLDIFYRVTGNSGTRLMFNYDSKLARSTLRRCTDILALAAATVMAGTGDLKTFRYLRRLHGRIDPETPYGSHLAAHLAIGVLFLGGGTYTFGTSDLAIASLICAFYPLYPTDVHDNHVHLQAFRHFWVFAAEARCVVVEDLDTKRPIPMPIILKLKNGDVKAMTAPCLVPELDTIATLSTDDPAYWRVTLDFANNPDHLSSFKRNQRILVRRCPASEAHSSTFLATLSALNVAHKSQPWSRNNPQAWQSFFNLPAFEDVDKADLELILPPDVHSSIYTDRLGTVVDDRLQLKKEVASGERDRLWDLRMLFAWADEGAACRNGSGREGGLKWIGDEAVDLLKAKVEERRRMADVTAES